jgi:hypothetical protein
MKHTVKKLTKKTMENYAGQGKVKFVLAQLILALLKQFLRALKAKEALLKSSTSGKAGGLNCEPLKAVIKP